ncbi:MAG: T9SS type A sorting domain-containing protein [Marinilabiliaceae bacterium]|nr:T9SS type A sorting domain-containing protein [Marinilabiliaceae bacterium]
MNTTNTITTLFTLLSICSPLHINAADETILNNTVMQSLNIEGNTVVIKGNVSIAENITVSNGTIIFDDDKSSLSVGGNIIIDNNLTLTTNYHSVNGRKYTIRVNGKIICNGELSISEIGTANNTFDIHTTNLSAKEINITNSYVIRHSVTSNNVELPITINGNLTMNDNSILRCMTDIYFQGDVTLDAQSTIIFDSGITAHFVGSNDATLTFGTQYYKYATLFQNIIIDKSEGASLSIPNSSIILLNNIFVNNGYVKGKISFCGSSTQFVRTQKESLAEADIYLVNHAYGSTMHKRTYPSVVMLSDAHIHKLVFCQFNFINIGSHNLKIDIPPSTSKSHISLTSDKTFVPLENSNLTTNFCGIVTNGTASDGGLSLMTNKIVFFPLILGNGNVDPIKLTAEAMDKNSIVNVGVQLGYTHTTSLYEYDFVTIAPVKGPHPEASNNSICGDFYWHIYPQHQRNDTTTLTTYECQLPASAKKISNGIYAVYQDDNWVIHSVPNADIEGKTTLNFHTNTYGDFTYGERNAFIKPFVWTGKMSNEWDDEENWSTNVIPTADDDAHIATTLNHPIISSRAHVNSISIARNALLEVCGDEASLIVNNDIKNNGDISLVYDYDNPIEVEIHGKVIGNNVTVKRHFQCNRLYYAGSATHEGKIGLKDDGFLNYNKDYLSGYNDSGLFLKRQDFGDDIVNSAGGIGLSAEAHSEKDNYILQYGSIESYVTINVGKVYHTGWHWISNPFPFSVKTSDFLNIKSGDIYSSIYMRGYEDGYYYTTFNTTYNTTTGSSDASTIAPFQAFCFYATEDNTTISLTPHKSNPTSLKTSHITPQTTAKIRLSVGNGNNYDDAVCILTTNASSTISNEDSPKIAPSARAPYNIFFTKDQSQLTIATYPSILNEDCQIMNFSIMPNEETSCTIIPNPLVIRISGIKDIFSSYSIFLYDRFSRECINLRNDTTFSISQAESLYENRFALILTTSEDYPETITSERNPEHNSIVISSYNHEVRVVSSSSSSPMTIQITDIAGRIVKKIHSVGLSITHLNTSGLYIITVKQDSQVTCQIIRI